VKISNFSPDKPEKEPKDQTKYCFILSDGEIYSKKLIKALPKAEIRNPIIINEFLSFIFLEIINKIIIHKKDPNNAENTNIHWLNSSIIKILLPKKITNATPKPAELEIPNTDGPAKGFLNNSCNKKPETGRQHPAKRAAIAL